MYIAGMNLSSQTQACKTDLFLKKIIELIYNFNLFSLGNYKFKK